MSEDTDARTPHPRRLDVLLEQYKLLEARRTSFGHEFMQTLGFVLAVFGGVVGLLGASSPLLHAVLRVAGGSFLLLAFLGYRVAKRQDHCERAMADVEIKIEGELGGSIARAPHGAKIGARLAIVVVLVAAGLALLFAPLPF